MRGIVRSTSRSVRAALMLALAGLWSSPHLSGQGIQTGTGGASLQVIDDLVVGNRILVNEGILDGLGHISVRHDQRPDRFLLSRDLPPAEPITPAGEYMRGWLFWKDRITRTPAASRRMRRPDAGRWPWFRTAAAAARAGIGRGSTGSSR